MSQLRSLIYASRSLLRPQHDADEVDRIVQVALCRNGRLRISGALAYTEAHFAQAIEGEPGAVDEIMASIARGPRHRDIHIVEDQPARERRFPDWAMAYAGPSRYVDGLIRPMMQAQDLESRQLAKDRLVTALKELARSS